MGTVLAEDRSTAAKFAGTWEGAFKGFVFCVLKINSEGQVSGTFSPGRISVNDEGDLTAAELRFVGESRIKPIRLHRATDSRNRP